ncbi:MAG: prefoldin subunit beta [Candidatus ainarchaeum sp.]|nr:prefoldin subunit beta [Candidatus ainarchaeum sp.]
MAELPPEIESKLAEFQGSQEQLQLVSAQKMQVKMQLDEVDAAAEALKGATGKVFKSVGMLVLESDRETVSRELAERKEALSVRAQVLGKQEERLRKRLLELRSEIESATKGMKPSGG